MSRGPRPCVSLDEAQPSGYTHRVMKTRLTWIVVFASGALFAAACGDSDDGGSSNGAGDGGFVLPDSGGGDGVAATTGGPGDGATPPPGTWVQPPGTVAISFFADDTANQTYEPGQIQWTGSFAWNKEDNTAEYAVSWLPEDREWPRLWDDGPISEAGHEAEGQVAGDHVYSTEIFFVPGAEEIVIEYGALNEFGSWIWLGPNGALPVQPDAEARLDAGGVTFPAFGDREVKLTIDLSALHEEYATINGEDYSIFVKGNMNSWTSVQILDNGKKGDDAADDGVYTYLHSTKLGPHDGLAFGEQHVQFVFVFAFVGTEPADGLEYKLGPDALVDGVRAWTGAVGDAELVEETLILELDSKGKGKNTTIVVTPGAEPPPGCSEEFPCSGGQECVDGECVAPPCSEENPCADGKECVDGACVAPPCSDENPCADGKECANGTCIDPAIPGEKPTVSLVDPATGGGGGGTEVTVSGTNFIDGAKVRFGTADATSVLWVSSGTLTCTTPPGAGSVTVTVENPDGKLGSYPGGFTYTDQPAPKIQTVEPDGGLVDGGTAVVIKGTGFVAGAKVLFGVNEAGAVSVQGGGTTISCSSPGVAEAGTVDVTVKNPDGQTNTKLGAFTYAQGLVNYATLEAPFDLSVQPGEAPGTVTVRAYHPGVTEAEGPGSGLLVDLGWGASGAEPSGGTWTWSAATYSGQGGETNNDDVWVGTLPSDLPPADYSWSFRLSLDGETWLYADRDGSSNGFTVATAGTLIVTAPPDGLAVFGLEPAWVPPGGGEVTVTGQEFTAASKVFFGGTEAGTTFVSASTLKATAPAHAPGTADVTVKDGGDTAAAPKPLVYGLVASPTIDGTIGADWPADYKQADDSATTGWDFNDLDGMWVAFDADYLYIGITGQVEAANALVVYVDVDSGAGTGHVPGAITDADGALDAALGGTGIAVTAPGFGAEFAAGGFGNVDATAGGLVANAGWRGLAEPANLAWLAGDVVWGAAGVELRVAWSELGLSPAEGGRTLGVFARIVSESGDFASPEGLPPASGEAGTVDSVAVVWVP